MYAQVTLEYEYELPDDGTVGYGQKTTDLTGNSYFISDKKTHAVLHIMRNILYSKLTFKS